MNAPTPRGQPDLERIAAAYDSPPWWYDARGLLILTFAYRSTLPAQIRFFGSNIGARHLEVAVGSGSLLATVLLWRRVRRKPRARIAAFDYAEPMLAGAIRTFRENADVELRQADVARLDYPDDAFDSANVANAFHCFPDPGAGLREILRVLKPGGTMAVNVLLFPSGWAPLKALADRINEWGMRKGILHSPYHAAAVEELVTQAGFQIVSVQRSGNTLNLLARKPSARLET